jgi:hypothetical protein
LLFQKRFHEGLLGGQITLTFRRWPKAKVKPGGRYRCHPIGVLAVDGLSRQSVRSLSEEDAHQAGFATRAELLEYLAAGSKTPLLPDEALFRVELHHAGEADFVAGADQARLEKDDRRKIADALQALDEKAAAPWTSATLALIAAHPRVAASKLAQRLGRETAPFKADVVKLKKLGLTQSFEVGYDLTPRGKAYLRPKPRSR